MGVVQSVGGSATSGKGLTDAHIRAAIIAALKNTENTDKERRQQLYNLIAGDNKASNHLSANEYSAEQATTCGVEDPATPDAATDDLDVVEYAPDVFGALRRLTGTTDADFQHEWTRAPPRANTAADIEANKGGMELGEGRSGALFLKSKSMAFMCKTISETEVVVLMSVLEKYLKHIEANPDSTLMRFVMMLKVTLNGEIGYILCFSDCFANCNVLHERWDLKGRKPKPGKFRHFVKHDLKKNTIKNDDDSSTDSEYERTKPSNRGAAANLRTADSRKALKLLTLKDKNLSRLFWLDPHVRTELISQLHGDMEFLLDCGLMDYSLLIGVRYNTPEERTQKEISRDSAMRPTFALGDEAQAGAVECRKSIANDEENPQLSSTQTFLNNINGNSSKFHQGVDNLECGETYYIGIIDMLTVYNGKKMTANFCKSFLWRENSLSTIPPRPYKNRIEKYAHQIFPLVEVLDEAAPAGSPTGITGKYDGMVKVATIHNKASPNNRERGIPAAAAAAPVAAAAAARGNDSGDESDEAFLNATVYPGLGSDEEENDEPTALHEAAGAGDVALMKTLIGKQEDLNAKDSNGRTPLHYAVKAKKLAAVQALIDAKAAINIEDRTGHTPLHVSALEGGAKIARLLIAADADLDAQDRAGCTPLHLAVENYNQDIVKVLIEAKADLNLAEEEGLTPLRCAMNDGDEDMIDLLRQSGALEEPSPNRNSRYD